MKNNRQIEPAPGDPVMQQFKLYRAALADTAAAVPGLLKEQRQLRGGLGRAEIAGDDLSATKERLAAVDAALASAGRQRASACESLLEMADDLRAARAVAAEELTAIAKAAISDFQMRWAHATAELGRLHSEAAILGQALRTAVPVMPPYVASLSADGTRTQVVFSGRIVQAAPKTRIAPGLPNVRDLRSPASRKKSERKP